MHDENEPEIYYAEFRPEVLALEEVLTTLERLQPWEVQQVLAFVNERYGIA